VGRSDTTIRAFGTGRLAALNYEVHKREQLIAISYPNVRLTAIRCYALCPIIRVIGRFGSPFHPLYMRIEKDGFYLQNGKLSGMLLKL
jgi:hypothetical protein